ncbi:hypothetical protein AQUCO_03900026v1 [Aquilegia coerulea]|uniref:Uncharacterized protein n=1 Tax=Aquilegia coerulea TaxID=218851 RepID=A0A2G5CRI4_AQUCA|nr:hypothetical protein AQUCO_03900026v1 [Aquilegia coerulea]
MGASQSQQSQHNANATEINNYQEEHTKPVPIAPKLPYNCLNIIKEADSRILSEFRLTDKFYVNFILKEKICEHLHHGVFLNGKRKKYWIEKESGYNCFMLYARDLNILGSYDPDRWKWSNVIEASSSDGDIFVEVAELLDGGHLHVQGKFNTSNLSPNTMYEIIFVVKMLNDPSFGWEIPVYFSLTLPNGETKGHNETLLEKPKGQWIELQVGEFYTSLDETREMKFSMIEQKLTIKKGGVIIKGVIIRPCHI